MIDSLSAHKGSRVRELIEAKGCKLLYLPPYSPDLNPIEQAWSTMKERLRQVGARTLEALEQAIPDALDAITPANASAWFRNCGYRSG